MNTWKKFINSYNKIFCVLPAGALKMPLLNIQNKS